MKSRTSRCSRDKSRTAKNSQEQPRMVHNFEKAKPSADD
ncbi:hypothetical protein VPHD527_0216 [Vibrio phage D527]